mmetsp:Transcript_113060/g.184216  ORF Transcript_113060/g.184216 Transcript_113060/m.184216 type:complete len:93 (+) Transcript_113060:134-412(+)
MCRRVNLCTYHIWATPARKDKAESTCAHNHQITTIYEGMRLHAHKKASQGGSKQSRTSTLHHACQSASWASPAVPSWAPAVKQLRMKTCSGH